MNNQRGEHIITCNCHFSVNKSLHVPKKDYDKLDSAYALLSEELKAVKAERDLVIAHDTQPYPTAYAYEMVCKADANKSLKTAELEKENERLKLDFNSIQNMQIEAEQKNMKHDLCNGRISFYKGLKECRDSENQTLKLKLAKAVEQRNAALNFDGSDPFSTRRNRYDAELSQITEAEIK